MRIFRTWHSHLMRLPGRHWFSKEGVEPVQLDARFSRLPRPPFAPVPWRRYWFPALAHDHRALEGQLAEAVRKGGTTDIDSGTVAPEHPVWVEFARSMAPMMAMPAELLAKHLSPEVNHASKILDLAAGHGLYGITMARHNPTCEVWAVDWPNVLQVAQENATTAGIKSRYHTLPGSAFDVEYGSGYDLVLMPNLLSHFDPPTCEKLLRRVHAALKPDGRAVILQMIPNEDRVSPPRPAEFALIMLASTPSGDAYTYPEYRQMLVNAGFRSSEKHVLMPDFFTIVVGHK